MDKKISSIYICSGSSWEHPIMFDNRIKKSKTSYIFTLTISLFIIFSSLSHAALPRTLSNGDSLKLVGIATHKELRNDIYIAALFGPPNITNVSQLKPKSVTKRMSLRFLSNLSNRKLARHWKERLAMNNKRSKWQPLSQEIFTFTQVFKRKMQVGDEINIDYIPNIGIQIYLNGTLFETIKKSDFMELLLNVWIGSNPSTKAFKQNIRGNAKQSEQDKLEARYLALMPIKGRFDADLRKVTEVASISPKKTTPKKLKPKLKPKKPAKQTKSNKTTKVATIKKPKPQPMEEPLFDADLISGAYTRELIDSVRKYQKYPRKAVEKNIQGDLVIKVIIDPKGNILEAKIVDGSGFRVLDKAAKKMIRKAAPFKAIPKELKLKDFEFKVPMSFEL